jgi:hypothetical protein
VKLDHVCIQQLERPEGARLQKLCRTCQCPAITTGTPPTRAYARPRARLQSLGLLRTRTANRAHEIRTGQCRVVDGGTGGCGRTPPWRFHSVSSQP